VRGEKDFLQTEEGPGRTAAPILIEAKKKARGRAFLEKREVLYICSISRCRIKREGRIETNILGGM